MVRRGQFAGCWDAIALGLISCAFVCSGCKRESRSFTVDPPSASTMNLLQLSTLQPGTNSFQKHVHNEYDENAYALSEGKRLFSNFNCSGCHAHGGGGMGPPLMDEKWIYGSAP